MTQQAPCEAALTASVSSLVRARPQGDLTSPPRIDLVVTDLDGTLWDGRGVIHPRTLWALKTLSAASVPVLAATGRSAAERVARHGGKRDRLARRVPRRGDRA